MEKTQFLDSVFLTGPDGFVYEFPKEVADAHRISEQRIAVLGHLPIKPYHEALALSEDTGQVDEVAGRHKVAGAGGGAAPANWSYHATWEYGTYLDFASGRFAQGIHRHPWGDERGEGASETEFA